MTDAPQPYRADDNQIRRNLLTHQWFTLDGQDYRCIACDANAYGRTAEYPCGQEPPRTTDKPLRIPLGKVPYETDGTGINEPEYGLDEPDPHDWGKTP
jgi:hypothetical protein